MDELGKQSNKLSAKKIALQKTFQEYSEAHGFSYEEWVNPPAGHFYENYKKELDEINNQLAPSLTYQ